MNAVLSPFKKQPRSPAAKAAPRPAPRSFSHGSNATGSPIPLPAPIRGVLDKVIRRQLAFRLAEFPALLLTLLPLMFLLQAAADRVFNLPWGTRLVLLLIDLGATGALFYFFAVLPWRRKLNLRTAALLVERTLPRLRTGLISAVELAAAPPAFPEGSSLLVQRLIRNVSLEMQRGGIPAQVVQATRLRKRLKWMAAALVLTIGAFCIYYPKSVVLGKRIFLSRAPLPTQTLVLALTRDASIPAGSDFELAAKAEGVLPRNGKVLVVYDDGRKETINVTSKPVEPSVFTVNLINVRQPFRYRFQLNDGVGSEYQVAIRVLPSLSLTKFTQIYPAYTGLKETEMSSGNLTLLAGGKLRIEAESSQPLKSAVLELKGLEQKIPMEITGADKRSVKAEIPTPREGLAALTIHLESTIGESSVNDPVYRVELVQDKPPTAALLAPKGEKITVLSNGKPSLTYTVRDDFGIRDVALVYEVFRIGGDGQPDLAEKGRLPLSPSSPQTTLKNTMVWDLGKLIPPLVVGSTVSYWIEVKDNNAVPGPATGISQKKTIEVVSEEAKKMELLEELSKKADEIERLSKSQRNVNDKTDNTIRANQENKP